METASPKMRNRHFGVELGRYDALSRVTEERLGQLGVFKYAYRGDTSLVASRLNPNGSVVEFEYGGPSEDHRLEEISHGLNFGRMGGVYKYQSNSLGLVTNAITFNSRGVQNLNESYTYDSLGRLLILNRKLPDAANSGVAYNLYGFDAADNLLQVWSNGNAAADVGSEFLVNALNQATQQDGATLTYDDNGNTLSSHGKVYAWDGHDRLVSAGTAANPNRSQWRYDGLDRRVQATDNGVITRYLWCGDDICAVLDGANKAKAYLYGSRGEFNAGRALLYSEDRLGNVRHVHEAKTGKWLLSLDYEAYGGVRDAACATASDCAMLLNGRLSKGYAGLYWHGPSGLYLAHYRAYDPGAKRWLNRDPIEEEGGLNLYAYVQGSPVMYTDSVGLWVGAVARCAYDAGVGYLSGDALKAAIRDFDELRQREADRKRARCQGQDGEALSSAVSDRAALIRDFMAAFNGQLTTVLTVGLAAKLGGVGPCTGVGFVLGASVGDGSVSDRWDAAVRGMAGGMAQ